jgi:hypothetical protein
MHNIENDTKCTIGLTYEIIKICLLVTHVFIQLL